MREQALHMIRRIQNKWRMLSLASNVLLSVAIILPPVFIVWHFTGWLFWAAVFFFMVAMCLLTIIDRSWRLTDREVARFLNKTYPSLQESCELLLRNPSTLNVLEELQVEKTSQALLEIKPPSLYTKLYRSLFAIVLAILICGVLSFCLRLIHVNNRITQTAVANDNAAMPGGVSDVSINIIPPAYTHKPVRVQRSMNLDAEEGASVHWKITLREPAREVKFIYNDSLVVMLKTNAEKLTWTTDKIMQRAGFYQLKIDSSVSELYRIEIKKDQAPVISILSPKPATVIEYGEPETVHIVANVSDDYGVKNVFINATVAKGSGEAVTFKAQKILFGNSFDEQNQQYNLQKIIGLRALGMEPGDELYFYLSATDNHDQEKKSDIFIVTLTDTAKLMSMDGLLNGVNLKPDYFRSERQIILDAEQLLRDRDTTSIENFNNRSNNLGIDQKLLRLRYGKYLGEEASSNENVSGDNALGNPENFGNANIILDAFTDHHDNAEDASFLDTDTKQRLKAVLTEMWSAELQLRLFKPKDALPFAYKALRLLKDLQQKSRAYVAKTSTKTPPIKLEKRLTGKLDKIIEPSVNTKMLPPEDAMENIRNALSVLENLKKGNNTTGKSIQVLRLAAAQLNNYAAREPGLYVSGLEAMKKIISNAQNSKQPLLSDVLVVQRALQRIAEAPALLPSKKTTLPAWSLQDAYFRNLQKNKN